MIRNPGTKKRMRPRIVIADDDPMVRDQIGSILEVTLMWSPELKTVMSC